MTSAQTSAVRDLPDATLCDGRGEPRRISAIFAVLSAMTLVVLDAGIANVALPTLGRALGASPGRAVLVVTAYQAGLIMALLPAGALGERFGHRRVFAIGVGAFAAASGLCALSPSLPWLIAARLAQGLGGAAIMALGVALLRFSVPTGRLGAAIGWNALTVALASAAAPSLGAAILSVAGWPALFAVNLPLAAATLAATRGLPASPRTAIRPDLASMALNALAFALLILAAGFAAAAPRHAALLLSASVVSFAVLVRREAPKSAPLVPLDLLRARSFRLSVIASVCCFVAQSAGLLALPFLLQRELGQTPLAAGFYITAWPLSVAVTAVAAGRLADRMPTARLCAAGGGCLSLGLAGATVWPLDGHPARLIPFVALAGVGFGLFQAPNNRNMFLSAPPDRSGAAGGMQASARVTGQMFGALAMTLLFDLVGPPSPPRIALAAASAAALSAALASLVRGRHGSQTPRLASLQPATRPLCFRRSRRMATSRRRMP